MKRVDSLIKLLIEEEKKWFRFSGLLRATEAR